jgi:hypothetical protein
VSDPSDVREPSPDTVTEAMALLQSEGYTADVVLGPQTVVCPACNEMMPLAETVVERMYRFEGESDPADEMIVLGLSCGSCGQKGLLVSAFGHDADRAHAEALRALAERGPF